MPFHHLFTIGKTRKQFWWKGSGEMKMQLMDTGIGNGTVGGVAHLSFILTCTSMMCLTLRMQFSISLLAV